MTGRGQALRRRADTAARAAVAPLRRVLGRVSCAVWVGVAAGLAAAGWLLAQPGGAPSGVVALVPGSVEGVLRLVGAALASALVILLVQAGGVAARPSPRRADLLRLAVGAAAVLALLVVLSDAAGAAAVVTGQEAPPAPAPVSTAPDLKAVLDNARNWLMGILATIATFF
ncbi:hypothetical protein, partial [Parafrankia elaeagni]|uniref:hypothetical protein n=1 Tax=Parafrankia elaeagni TaxID=222534 RepID=UPI0005599D59